MAILHVCNFERYVFFCIYLKFVCIDPSGRPVFYLCSPIQKALLLREAASLRLLFTTWGLPCSGKDYSTVSLKIQFLPPPPTSPLRAGQTSWRSRRSSGRTPMGSVFVFRVQWDKLLAFFLECSVLIWLSPPWLFSYFLSFALIRETLNL